MQTYDFKKNFLFNYLTLKKIRLIQIKTKSINKIKGIQKLNPLLFKISLELILCLQHQLNSLLNWI